MSSLRQGAVTGLLLVGLVGVPLQGQASAAPQQVSAGPQQTAPRPASSGVTVALPETPGVCAIQGTVRGSDGGIVPGATVELMTEGKVEVRSVQSDEDGAYLLGNVACGQYVLSVTMKGFLPVAIGESLPDAGGVAQVDVVLKIGTSDDVTVVATQREIAAAQVHLQEQQRLVGMLPNFFVSYQWRAAPLTAKQKFKLAARTAIDPGTFGVTAISTAVEYLTGNYSEFGDGFTGYSALYGSSYGLAVSGSLLGGAVFPSLFRQDPRYFYKGTGGVRSRAWYAVTRAVVTRGDNAKPQFNWSGILGNFAAGGTSNLFVPAVDRKGAGVTISNGLLGVGSDCFNNLMEEFVLRKFTTKTKGRRGKASDTP